MEILGNSTRDMIILAAIELFAENGYTETSMRTIAKAANIKPASIYNHFESKKQILEYILGIYSDFAFKDGPGITEEFIKENDAATVLKALFFKFDNETSSMYKQIIKIFLQEQYRIDEARDFMKEQYIKGTQIYIKFVLDKMVEYKKIAAIDTGIFAEILHSINVKATVLSGHYINEIIDEKEDRWEDALHFMINIILNS